MEWGHAGGEGGGWKDVELVREYVGVMGMGGGWRVESVLLVSWVRRVEVAKMDVGRMSEVVVLQ